MMFGQVTTEFLFQFNFDGGVGKSVLFEHFGDSLL
jgi:hypothetical protein